MRRRATLLAMVLPALLAACASEGGVTSQQRRVARQTLQRLPPAAQPTNVIATELAFARAAREEGQWTAYADHAASDAQIGAAGTVAPADSWLAGRSNPATAERWAPRQAWSSCDGSAVMVSGIGTDAGGSWHRFTRIWVRDGRNGPYRWIASTSQPDAELTRVQEESARERAEAAALDSEAILVEAASFIRARVADCGRPDATAATPTPAPAPSPHGSGPPAASRDGTLRWQWQADGSLTGSFLSGGQREVVPADPINIPAGGA